MDDATRYALAVCADEIIAGKPVRQACQRHLDDLKHAEQLGIWWDGVKAANAIEFFEQILTVESDGQSVKFSPEPFQRFIIGCIFGWKNADGTRRFRNAYIEQGKGNGKTPLAAGIGLYCLMGDGELYPEVYSAATMRDQAAICFQDAVKMVHRSDDLRGVIEERVGSLRYAPNGGIFRPVSSEHKGLDGKRVHVALIDELHEHPTSMVVDKMRAGTKRRRNALILRITNSGCDLESVCWHEHEYSLKVLDGSLEDLSWFAYVCSLDEGDDWQDESVWLKANPGLGKILPVSYLREQVREAQGMPSKQNLTKRLNFCIWTQQHEVWIPIEAWAACNEPLDLNVLDGQPCWIGLDLSDKIDLSVAVAVFRRELGKGIEVEVPIDRDERTDEPVREKISIDFGVDILPFYFIPEDTMYEREKEDMVPYSRWVKDGQVIATPGSIINYDVIFETIASEIGEKYQIQQIRYDPRGATQLARQLGEAGYEMVEQLQGFNQMTEPSQIFEALVRAKRIRHGNHPVLRWNVQNVAVAFGKYGDIRPIKSHRKKRIDGVVGAVMGIAGVMAGTVKQPKFQFFSLG